MLKITEAPFNLVKWHVNNTYPEEIKNIIIIRTSDFKEVKDSLLESVNYDLEGELTPSFYLINYVGSYIPKEVKISDYNTTYLVVQNASKWKHLSSEKVKLFNVKPIEYQDIIYSLSSIMTPEVLSYFWSHYCIKEFACNPYKWYNESRRLLALYAQQKPKKMVTKEDLDCLYGKVSDVVKPYLSNIFTEKSRYYIKQMTNTELFVVFVGTEHKKALILHYVTKLREDFLPVYMIFRQAFEDGSIRLSEGVFILDYLLNKKTKLDLKEVKNLFGVQ